MKKLVLIYCLFTVSIFSQWVPQTSGTIEKLNDAIFQNQTTGYVCGNSGVILKTTDGGTNWIAKPSNTSHDLKCIMINPVNNDYVLAVGNVSTLLLSTNAGATFSNVAVSPVDWNKVRHADIFNVYVCGGMGRVAKSTNAGANWTIIPVNSSDTLISMWVFNSTTVIVGAKHGKMFKTTDSGSNWVQISNAFPDIDVKDFYFQNSSTGYAISGGVSSFRGEIMKTVNGGMNWFSTYLMPTYVDMDRILIVGNEAYITYTDKISLHYGNILKSFSGASGTQWYMLQTVFSNTAPALTFGSSTILYAVGTGGRILKSTNSGGDPIGVQPVNSEVPQNFSLSQNYPNPFNPVTNIEFSLPQSSNINLTVFNAAGKQVAEITNGYYTAGIYKADFDASDLSSGVYFYKLTADKFTETKKMILVK